MASKLILLAATLQVIFVVSSNAQECRAPGITKGKCVPYWKCPSVLDGWSKVRWRKDVVKIQNLVCKTGQGYYGFCCENTKMKRGFFKQSSQSTDSTLINPLNCGKIGLIRNIIGGTKALPYSWPWIARVGKVDKSTGEIAWGCGGSLITRKHVITAAHCVSMDRSLHGLMYVRLGELDVTQMNESVTVDIPVKAKILHEGYRVNPLRNDIAILELEEEVPSTKTIAPVCLPFGKDISQQSLSGTVMKVAGWGTMQNGGETNSDYLMHVDLTVWSVEDCIHRFREEYSVGMDKTKICAAGSHGTMRDACRGDSGGPLVHPGPYSKKMYLFGVVSAGIKNGCAGEFPGIYTRVTSYQKWIEDVVNGTSGVGNIIRT